jgi:hypothetical protein
LLFGRLKAGTPLLIASTPVSAAQPEENARSSRKPHASPASPWANCEVGTICRSALSTRGRSDRKYRANPYNPIPMIESMNA